MVKIIDYTHRVDDAYFESIMKSLSSIAAMMLVQYDEKGVFNTDATDMLQQLKKHVRSGESIDPKLIKRFAQLEQPDDNYFSGNMICNILFGDKWEQQINAGENPGIESDSARAIIQAADPKLSFIRDIKGEALYAGSDLDEKRPYIRVDFAMPLDLSDRPTSNYYDKIITRINKKLDGAMYVIDSHADAGNPKEAYNEAYRVAEKEKGWIAFLRLDSMEPNVEATVEAITNQQHPARSRGRSLLTSDKQ